MPLPPNWREDVCERFPELRQEFDYNLTFSDGEPDTPYQIWSQLLIAFNDAYERSPRDDALIRRIYEYAFWCAEDAPRGQTAGDDLLTCVCVCFFEHIPQRPLPRADMPRWFMYEDLIGMEQIFRYFLSDQEFDDLKQYFKEHSDMYVPRVGSNRTA